MRQLIVVLFFAAGCLLQAQNYDFSKVPGTVIAHSPSIEKTYLGTPSICILPDGTYVASHSMFGAKNNIVPIFISKDRGKNWTKVSEVRGFWSGLFVHREVLYLMGVDAALGNCIIRKSLDGGRTWSSPDDSSKGLIRAADLEKGFHTSAVSVVEAFGRIWRPFEVAPKEGKWGLFEALVLSAPVDADLLNAKSWTSTTRMSVDTCWGKQYNTWLEGGAVISPRGNVVNVLRVDNRREETAAIVHVADNGKTLSFNPEKDFIRFPGGCKRFVIRYDSISNRYWSLTNWVPDEFKGHNVERTRNTLALISSEDMRDWTVHEVILQDANVAKSGFQYVDWQFENEDMIFISRTAFFDGVYYADNQHNANFITFHRIESFRNKLKKNIITINN